MDAVIVPPIPRAMFRPRPNGCVGAFPAPPDFRRCRGSENDAGRLARNASLPSVADRDYSHPVAVQLFDTAARFRFRAPLSRPHKFLLTCPRHPIRPRFSDSRASEYRGRGGSMAAATEAISGLPDMKVSIRQVFGIDSDME